MREAAAGGTSDCQLSSVRGKAAAGRHHAVPRRGVVARMPAGLAFFLALALLPASCDLPRKQLEATASTPAPATTATAYDDAILELINAHRRSIGKAALEENPVIWAQANQHSRNMAAGVAAFGHDGFDARARSIYAALGTGATVSENVATGPASAESVVNRWLKSAAHKANIESAATRTGISAVRSAAGIWFYTQIFY